LARRDRPDPPHAAAVSGTVPPVPYQDRPYHERFVSNNGVTIRYLDNDPADPHGLPIVFVPGIIDFADDYQPTLEFFAPRRLIVVEMRGRGGSDAPDRGYSVPEQAGDVEAVIAANELSAFHLMTFSRGTTPAIEVARRTPRRAATLAIGDYLAIEVRLTPEFTERQWRGRWRGRPVSERVSRHVLDGIQADSQPRDLWEAVGALGIPVLVARGSDGGILRDDHVERYRRAVPGVEVVVIPGATHDLFRPDRTAYPTAVRDFIARRAPGS
jgi:pimeloyl-ACP methyl ester carboxylesterase